MVQLKTLSFKSFSFKISFVTLGILIEKTGLILQTKHQNKQGHTFLPYISNSTIFHDNLMPYFIK